MGGVASSNQPAAGKFFRNMTARLQVYGRAAVIHNDNRPARGHRHGASFADFLFFRGDFAEDRLVGKSCNHRFVTPTSP